MKTEKYRIALYDPSTPESYEVTYKELPISKHLVESVKEALEAKLDNTSYRLSPFVPNPGAEGGHFGLIEFNDNNQQVLTHTIHILPNKKQS